MTFHLFGPLYIGALVVFYAAAARVLRPAADKVEDAGGVALDLLALFTFAMTVGAPLVYATFNPDARAMGMKGGPAVFLVLLAVYVAVRRGERGLVLDAAAVALPSAFAMAKIACTAAGCCYGTPSNLPWAVPSGRRWDDPDLARHPTQIYDAALALLVALVVGAVARRYPRRGTSLVVSVLLLAVARIATEWLRGDVTPIAGVGLTSMQVLLVPVALGSGALLVPPVARAIQALLPAPPTPTAIKNETRPRSWVWPALAIFGAIVSYPGLIVVAWLRVFGMSHERSIWPAPAHLWRWVVIVTSFLTMAGVRTSIELRPSDLAGLTLAWSIIALGWITAIVAYLRQQSAPLGLEVQPALGADPEPDETEADEVDEAVPRRRRERRPLGVRRPRRA